MVFDTDIIAARRVIPILLAAAVATPRPAQAAAPMRPAAFALIVGSNRGGPGQKKLRYAHEDAKRVREVLISLGGYAADRVVLSLEPTPAELLKALERSGRRLKAARAAGRRPLFLFYYSGHARARALDLGREELPLAELRKRLLGLPATATVAILDACQTGAISQIKGATPARDFTFNSVRDLDTVGVAVMASSSASELSQEADSLRSSYFTHHLLVGLRGAADDDGNGRVTLSEVYRYAYNRTLIATAKTAVGKQHVTLETRLSGKGEMVLTFPARATSALALPKSLGAEVLVHRPPAQHVLAELHKAAGRELRIALPPGRYIALVRQSKKQLRRCKLALAPGTATKLDLSACSIEVPTPGVSKGPVGSPGESWAIELGIGALFTATDRFDDRLDDFGYRRQTGFFEADPAISAALMWSYSRYVSLGLRFALLDRDEYVRSTTKPGGSDRRQRFEWATYTVGLFFRGTLPLLDDIVRPYVQAGLGLGWANAIYTDPQQASTIEDDELHWGPVLSASAGIAVMPWRFLGGFIQLDYDYAPVVGNLVGDTHDSGGLRFIFGLRGAL